MYPGDEGVMLGKGVRGVRESRWLVRKAGGPSSSVILRRCNLLSRSASSVNSSLIPDLGGGGGGGAIAVTKRSYSVDKEERKQRQKNGNDRDNSANVSKKMQHTRNDSTKQQTTVLYKAVE